MALLLCIKVLSMYIVSITNRTSAPSLTPTLKNPLCHSGWFLTALQNVVDSVDIINKSDVRRWLWKCKKGESSIKDNPRNGRPSTVTGGILQQMGSTCAALNHPCTLCQPGIKALLSVHLSHLVSVNAVLITRNGHILPRLC